MINNIILIIFIMLLGISDWRNFRKRKNFKNSKVVIIQLLTFRDNRNLKQIKSTQPV